MKKKLVVFFILGMVIVPMFALAANNNCMFVESGTIEAVVCRIGQILNTIIPILIVLGVLLFVWGVVQYVIGSDEEAKKKGKDRMIYGIIGLVVIVGMWGLVGIVTKTFNVSNSGAPVVTPCVPGTPGC